MKKPDKQNAKNSGKFTLRLGTRSSTLALTQSRMIARMLEKACRGLRVELIEISTTGDRVHDKALKSFGGAGVFVKELETALLEKRIDIAVHSLKDVPTQQPRGLAIAAIVGREDPRDCVITRGGVTLEELRAGSVVGSGSERRRAQLIRLYPKLKFAEIRGNVETRINKVLNREFAATILARAGLKRLGLLKKSSQTLSLAAVLPAPGQGALGIESRSADRHTRKLLESIHNPSVAICVETERTLLAMLGGGCNLPLGALGTVRAGKLQLRAFLGLADGSKSVEAQAAVALGGRAGLKVAGIVFEKLWDSGAQDILKALTKQKLAAQKLQQRD